jgi:hypothetical protein
MLNTDSIETKSVESVESVNFSGVPRELQNMSSQIEAKSAQSFWGTQRKVYRLYRLYRPPWSEHFKEWSPGL